MRKFKSIQESIIDFKTAKNRAILGEYEIMYCNCPVKYKMMNCGAKL